VCRSARPRQWFSRKDTAHAGPGPVCPARSAGGPEGRRCRWVDPVGGDRDLPSAHRSRTHRGVRRRPARAHRGAHRAAQRFPLAHADHGRGTCQVRTDNGPQNLAALRTLAINALRLISHTPGTGSRSPTASGIQKHQPQVGLHRCRGPPIRGSKNGANGARNAGLSSSASTRASSSGNRSTSVGSAASDPLNCSALIRNIGPPRRGQHPVEGVTIAPSSPQQAAPRRSAAARLRPTEARVLQIEVTIAA
jgi:hypothetical protein